MCDFVISCSFMDRATEFYSRRFVTLQARPANKKTRLARISCIWRFMQEHSPNHAKDCAAVHPSRVLSKQLVRKNLTSLTWNLAPTLRFPFTVHNCTTVESGVMIPCSRPLAIAAARVCTPSFKYTVESRLRSVELAIFILRASSAVLLFG